MYKKVGSVRSISVNFRNPNLADLSLVWAKTMFEVKNI